ncbi:MAG: tetratricopeptide repeat-containing sensor histidine kinase, partial [Ignavibacteriae bacterium]|nr:tetratricopeptide repeat-containing sensor histidine kinase [Ignavibacteriota bacterium]
EHFNSSLKIAEASGNKNLTARILSNLGVLHKELSNNEIALEYYKKALEINESLNNKSGIERDLGNLGIIYIFLSDSPLALECFHKALALTQELGDKEGIARHLGNLGNVYATFEIYPKALEYFLKSAALSEEIGSKGGLSGQLANIGNVYYYMEEYQSALVYLLKALEINEEIGARKKNLIVCGSLAAVYERIESWKEANEFNKKHQLLNDEIYSEEVKKLTDKVLYERKIAEREMELAVEQARSEEITRQKQILEEQAAKIQLKNTELNEKNIQLNSVIRQLEEANDFKMKILGIASHDLKNPISGIKLSAEMLLKYEMSASEIVHSLQMITGSSKRMLDIVVNLIDVAARELGQIKLSPSTVDIAKLASNAISEYLDRASEKKQILEFYTDDNLSITADEMRLRQVLDNLISNAIKYSELGKTIRVSITQSAKGVIIAVKDQGQGLTEEDKPLLFKDFQKLSARPTGGEGSTGLGLAVVKHLVELHGGNVWAESEGKDKGSTFFVELPVVSS